MGANPTQAQGVGLFLIAFVLLAAGLAKGGSIVFIVCAIGLLALSAAVFIKCKPWEHRED